LSDRRLIEEYLPIEAVSLAAASEKIGGRLSHISTLHIWWARRPLAAARAAVFAALVPAPDEVNADGLATFFGSLCAWTGPDVSVQEARRQVLVSSNGTPPRVLDLFAGGGAIPLEASRLGCEATAIELNPVAHLIELGTLDYPQRFGPSLADEVRVWGRWLIERVKESVGGLYPELADSGSNEATQRTLDGIEDSRQRTPIAYLWTRTVPCPNQAVGEHRVPLVRQTWLAKKKGRFAAIRPIADRKTMTLAWEVVEATSREGLDFDPSAFSERGTSTCPFCGASVDLDYVKRMGHAGLLGTDLMAVALVRPGTRGKSYVGSAEARTLLPPDSNVHEKLGALATEGFEGPAEKICAEDTLNFKVPLYGLERFSDLFTTRQLTMLLTFCRVTHEAHTAILSAGVEPERARAIATYLGFLVDRIADRSSTICRWDSSPSYEGTTNTFARQALPMTWDFSESNPFGGASGDAHGQLEYIAAVIDHCAKTGTPTDVIRCSATELPLEDGSQDAVITDPPYYDNISYADLSDFFYVWLKRSIGHLYPEHLSGELTPKRSEVIAAPYRHHESKAAARDAYEAMMAKAFSEARRVLKPDGVMVCVYAHQTTAGWATLIEAVRHAGFVVVEAWPLDTEMATRGVAQGTASLASSIFLVARPRTETATGDWAHDVRPELQEIVSGRVEELTRLGISGTDLVIAAIGSGMRAYTRFARVEKPNGDELAPGEYLEEVEREVTETILARIFRTDRAGLGRVDQPTQFYVMGRFEFRNEFGPWDELNTLARGTGVEIRELTVGDHALVGFGKNRSEARVLDYTDRGEAIDLGRSTIDHLHRVLWLAENTPDRVREYIDSARPDADKLRLVAQALSRPGLDVAIQDGGPEIEACQRLLVSWKRLIDDNLFTGSTA
jgi:putative DNA methylase